MYSEENDILLADAGLVAVHSIKSGPKRIVLPQPSDVWDVITGQPVGKDTGTIEFDLAGPATRVFRVSPVRKN